MKKEDLLFMMKNHMQHLSYDEINFILNFATSAHLNVVNSNILMIIFNQQYCYIGHTTKGFNFNGKIIKFELFKEKIKNDRISY